MVLVNMKFFLAIIIVFLRKSSVPHNLHAIWHLAQFSLKWPFKKDCFVFSLFVSSRKLTQFDWLLLWVMRNEMEFFGGFCFWSFLSFYFNYFFFFFGCKVSEWKVFSLFRYCEGVETGRK